MDLVFIRDLRIETTIGVDAWERQIRQIVSIDLEMAADVRRAAASDAIADAVDYQAVTRRLVQLVGASQFRLLETLAETVAERLLAEFEVPWLRLRVSKPGAVRGAREAGVVIERGSLESERRVTLR